MRIKITNTFISCQSAKNFLSSANTSAFSYFPNWLLTLLDKVKHFLLRHPLRALRLQPFRNTTILKLLLAHIRLGLHRLEELVSGTAIGKFCLNRALELRVKRNSRRLTAEPRFAATVDVYGIRIFLAPRRTWLNPFAESLPPSYIRSLGSLPGSFRLDRLG